LADNLLRAGQVGYNKQLRALKDPKVETKSDKRRSYYEILALSLPALDSTISKGAKVVESFS
jgi:hypothetical protein